MFRVLKTCDTERGLSIVPLSFSFEICRKRSYLKPLAGPSLGAYSASSEKEKAIHFLSIGDERIGQSQCLPAIAFIPKTFFKLKKHDLLIFSFS